MTLAEQLRPDVLLVDLRMPKLTGLDVARRLQTSAPDVGVIILSAYDDVEQIPVAGYLVKGCSATLIFRDHRQGLDTVIRRGGSAGGLVACLGTGWLLGRMGHSSIPWPVSCSTSRWACWMWCCWSHVVSGSVSCW